MKPISVKDYQAFCVIPRSGRTDSEYYGDMAKLIGIDTTSLNFEQVKKKTEDWKEKLVASKVEHKYIKLDKTWYKVDRDLYTMAFTQWIRNDRIMKSLELSDMDSNLHIVISTFIRPCRFYKFFPKKFTEDNAEVYSTIIREKLDITIALELTNFFLSAIMSSLNATRISYLGKLDKEAWEIPRE